MKIAEGNVEYDTDGVLHLPLFGACFLDPPKLPEMEPLDFIEELNKMNE